MFKCRSRFVPLVSRFRSQFDLRYSSPIPQDGIEATHDMRVIENEQGWHRSRILALTGLSNESDMAKGLGQGGVDKWLVKGGKSLRLIIEEVVEMQKEVAERRLCEEA